MEGHTEHAVPRAEGNEKPVSVKAPDPKMKETPMTEFKLIESKRDQVI